MLDIGGSELLVIALVLILVVGPKDLPRVLRTAGRFMAKMRGMTREFQRSIDDMAREADIADMRKELKSVSDVVSGPAADSDLAKKIENTIDSSGELRDSLKEGVESTGDSNGDAAKDVASKTSAALPPLAPGPDAETPKNGAASSSATPDSATPGDANSGDATPSDDVDAGAPATASPEAVPAAQEDNRVPAGGAAEA